MIRGPPISTSTDTLFPSTTRVRSRGLTAGPGSPHAARRREAAASAMAHSPTEPTEPVMGVEPPSQPVAEDALDALEEGDRVLKPGSARSALDRKSTRLNSSH